MAKIVTFGEVLMRLSTPGFQKIQQANAFEIIFGGTEMNVAAGLAQWGHTASHAGVFPDNLIGKKAKSFMAALGLETQDLVLNGKRIGLFFLETGAVHRASQIVYDRADSAFANLDPTWFDWEKILKGADWFHWCGITPAISEGAAAACLEALKVAKKLYYRSNLWNYGKTPQDILPELASYSDIILASRKNLEEIFGISPTILERGKFQDTAERFMKLYKNVSKVVDTDREQVSASHNRLGSKLYNGQAFYKTEALDVTHIVDRIGTGDSFLAGFIHAQLLGLDDLTSLKYGDASSALKHTIPGDQTLVGLSELENLVAGDMSGRLKR
jgi:2-dehydro-3-deoxygluconokinase